MMHDLSGFQRDLVYVLAGEEELSGQGVRRRLEETTPLRVNHGRLYPNLDKLVEEGYVEKGSIDRRTNYYELTDDGRTIATQHMQWASEQVEKAESVEPPSP